MTNRFPLYQTAKLALTLGMMYLAPGLASAQGPHCTVLSGTYAFSFAGTTPNPGPPAIMAPYNGVCKPTFDGAGKLTAVESANFGGFVLRNAPFSGTYTLAPDCTGTITVKFPDGSIGHNDFVVSDGGKTLLAISTDPLPPGASLVLTFTKIPVTW